MSGNVRAPAERSALIAGGGGPWPRAAALALAEAGFGIALLARASNDAHVFAMSSIANELWALDHLHVTLTYAPADAASVANAVVRAEAELGPIGFVVNAPEPSPPQTALFLELAYADWQRELLRQIDGVALICHAAGTAMLARGGGVLNLVGSQSMGAAGVSAVAAGEGAVLALTRSLAREWHERVAVNAAVIGSDAEPAALASLVTLLAGDAVRPSTAVSGQVFEL